MKRIMFSMSYKLVTFLFVIFLNGCDSNEQEKTVAYFDLKVVLAKSEILHQEKNHLERVAMILKSTYDEKEKDKTHEQTTYSNTREVNQRKLHDHFLSCRQSARHQIIKEIMGIAKKISNEHGLTIKNYETIILAPSNSIDVTDQVIEALKKNYVSFESCI
ncbi:OmpH family outer membrane protein [Enterobacter hormaechei]|uniref:OmpH family outer membrane protein n=1 Tax=Enterobacter hormaechei TaxID=158836 RepID=UPI00263BDE15|nr:OmpH family outer membrane protein [Enterobacter hormaechei]MDN5006977.1 OmpH family outer membrane protein [Enterobacter hormaechei]MDO1523447.1 OmpH family outer membrane protein [Enterobacter hormaechei]